MRSLLILLTLIALNVGTIRGASSNVGTYRGTSAASDTTTNVGAAAQVDSIAPADSLRDVRTYNGTSQHSPSLPAEITPVDIDRERPQGPILHYYDRHGNPLDTPVRFLLETDTIARPKAGPKYPTFNGVTVGVNFFDAIMMIFGQKRANFDISVSCSLWNWLMPVAEIGVGYSNSHPDDGRTYFKVPASLYTKLGFNYNFLYKSNPDYKIFAGFRVGYSNFNYSIPHIAAGSQYYTDAAITSVSGLHGSSVYGEVLIGLEVKLWKALSMGWTARYNFNFKNKWRDPAYPAWFIPGRNASTPVSASFSLLWRIGPTPTPKE